MVALKRGSPRKPRAVREAEPANPALAAYTAIVAHLKSFEGVALPLMTSVTAHQANLIGMELRSLVMRLADRAPK